MHQTESSQGPVTMLTDDIYAMSRALNADRDRFRAEAAKALAKLRAEDDDGAPLGVDPRNVPAGHAMRRYRETRERAEELVEQISDAFTAMARGTQALVNAFGDQDALNAASVEDVRTVLGIAAPAPHPNQR